MAASAFLVRTGKKKEHFLGSCSLCGSSTTGLYPEDISLSLIFDLLWIFFEIFDLKHSITFFLIAWLLIVDSLFTSVSYSCFCVNKPRPDSFKTSLSNIPSFPFSCACKSRCLRGAFIRCFLSNVLKLCTTKCKINLSSMNQGQGYLTWHAMARKLLIAQKNNLQYKIELLWATVLLLTKII